MAFTSYTTSNNKIGIAQTDGNDRYRLYYPGGTSKGSSNYERLFYVGEYDGKDGYDILRVDWGQYGTSHSVSGSNGSYTVTLNSSLGTYTSFRAKNVEEIRFIDGTWLAPSQPNSSPISVPTNSSPTTQNPPTTTGTRPSTQIPTWNWSPPVTQSQTSDTDAITGQSIVNRQLREDAKGLASVSGKSDIFEFKSSGVSPWDGGASKTLYTISNYETNDRLKSDAGAIPTSITGIGFAMTSSENAVDRLRSYFGAGFGNTLGVEPEMWQFRTRKRKGKKRTSKRLSPAYSRWTGAGSHLLEANEVFAYNREGDTWLLVNDSTAGFDMNSDTDTVIVIKDFVASASSPITFI